MKYQFLFFLFLLSAGMVGCQGRGTLQGKVTYKDQPLLTGFVQVRGSDGLIKTSKIENGAYAVPDLPIGPADLIVVPPPSNQTADSPRKPAENLEPEQVKWEIHPDYSEFSKSGLSVTIQKGENTYPIELKEK